VNVQIAVEENLEFVAEVAKSFRHLSRREKAALGKQNSHSTSLTHPAIAACRL